MESNRVKSFLADYFQRSLPLQEALQRNSPLNESEALEAVSRRLQIPMLSRNEYPEAPQPYFDLSLAFMMQCGFIPIKVTDEVACIAVNDPLNLSVLQAVEEACSPCCLELRLGRLDEIQMALERQYGEKSRQDGLDDDMDRPIVADDQLFAEGVEYLEDLAKDATVVRRVDFIINKALDMRASDIHFEPYEQYCLVRFRVDGILSRIEEIPKSMQAAVASRIKLMAQMDIAERRLPQDGGIDWTSQGRRIDVRVATAPTLWGENIVLRLLTSDKGQVGLGTLGMTEGQLSGLDSLIYKSNGMILVTGPTGSGKTTTLYSVLQKIKSDTKKIFTIEDPVEYKIEGINQIQVKPQINLTFANALRSLLRQDPDVMLIGEIRDYDTADIAIESALTGHLVLSTLHTNDAPGAVTRLRDLHVESFLIADSLLAVMAQRLVRVLCSSCRQQYEADENELSYLRRAFPDLQPPVTLWKNAEEGCPECGRLGFKGREGIFELLLVDKDVSAAIVSGADAVQIGNAARKSGYSEMIVHGMHKVLSGVTTLSEVLRVATSF